jgi:kynurenine formamidase
MCHVCVMENVKSRMLSRRDLFRVGAAGAAAATLGATLAPRPALAQAAGSVADMTHTLGEDFPTFFGEQQFFETQVFNYAEHMFNLKEIRVNEHTGTHVDAPLHFSADGQSVDEIPVDRLVCPLAVIDIRARAAEDADTRLTPDDIRAWIATHGPIPAGACVAMLSGWGEHVNDAKFRNADDAGAMHFPGFHIEAAQMLIEEADVAGIAVDTLSLDHGISPDFATHYAWLPTNRWGIECIANLDQVPASGATLIVGAPKHRGGTGGPARIFTLF